MGFGSFGPAAGGQPGPVRVHGAVIYGDNTIDDAIKIQLNAGRAKNGSRAITTAKPDISPEADAVDLSATTKSNTLVTVGCDPKIVKQFAEDNSLDILPFDLAKASGAIEIHATMIALCANLNGVHLTNATFDADELLLSNLDYTQEGPGQLSLNANRLSLVGHNRIEAKGLAAVPEAIPTLTLNVIKEIKNTGEDDLTLISEGASFASATPKKK